MTIGQLAGLLCEIDSQGRMKLESKEQARARRVPSPDRAEALMLALCKPRQKYEYYSARNPLGAEPRLTGDRPSDDDDDYRYGGRGRWDGWVSGSLARHFARRPGTW